MKRISRYQSPPQASTPLSRQRTWRRSVLVILVVATIAAGGASTYYWLKYRQGAASNWVDTQAQDVANGVWSSEREVKEEATLPNDVLARYTVEPSLPRALYINRLSVAARILPMGVNTDGTMQAPYHIDDTGWYAEGVKPGEKGAVFIDGHASGATRKGVFAYLDTLKPGDSVRLEKGSGAILAYEVVYVESVPLEKLDMRTVLQSYEGVERGLNLMTCAGKWLADSQTYDHRVVVYTRQLES